MCPSANIVPVPIPSTAARVRAAISERPETIATQASRPLRTELPGGYAVEDANGQRLGTFYGRADPNVARQAGTLTLDEARRKGLGKLLALPGFGAAA
jgi:hypothetical protein